MKELIVVMPVYNEEAVVATVVKKWVAALQFLGIDFEIWAMNDGSKDGTGKVLETEASLDSRIRAVNKPNSGHGPTILMGYRNASREAHWVFQIDSDDEMGPESFSELWRMRNNFDFLIGKRDSRSQPLPRKVISFVSRMTVRIFWRKSVWDVNSPYRLMRSERFSEVFNKIPEDTFAPNVIVSGWAGLSRLRVFEVYVPHQERKTGEVSIKKWKLLKAAVRSFGQTIKFRSGCSIQL